MLQLNITLYKTIHLAKPILPRHTLKTKRVQFLKNSKKWPIFLGNIVNNWKHKISSIFVIRYLSYFLQFVVEVEIEIIFFCSLFAFKLSDLAFKWKLNELDIIKTENKFANNRTMRSTLWQPKGKKNLHVD